MGDNLVPANLGQGALDVVAGDVQSCARLTDQSPKCWGTWVFIQQSQRYPNADRSFILIVCFFFFFVCVCVCVCKRLNMVIAVIDISICRGQ